MIKKHTLKTIIIYLGILLSPTILYAAPTVTTSNEAITAETNNIEHIIMDVLYTPKDLKDVENFAEVIVKAEVLEERENVELVEDAYGFTKTKLKINKVYAGDLKIDDIITIAEEYFQYTDNYTGETHIEAVNLYEPTAIGNEYIFFLYCKGEIGTAREGSYQIVCITYGKYPVVKNSLNIQKGDTMSNSDLNIGEGDISKYKAIYKEVVKQYK